ncbi:MAG: hypothetical protein Q9212_001390 [Teloschistes hypoglaucus]
MAYDPLVSNLFATSLGPSKANRPARSNDIDNDHESFLDETISASGASIVDGNESDRSVGNEDSDVNPTPLVSFPDINARPKSRRKRNRDEDDIEGTYLQRLAEEDPNTGRRNDTDGSSKRRKVQIGHSPQEITGTHDTTSCVSNEDVTPDESVDESDADTPQHESLASSKESLELEKAARTIFLANVSTSCITHKTAKKSLLSHLTSFCSLLPSAGKSHKIESLRFRSTAFSSGVGPKKAAFAKRQLMNSTTRSTNAYAVYSTQLAAREAVKKLNGTTILDRHLLVDSVSHPRKIDHRRCVFVGNLGFVDDESQMNAAKDDDENKKPRKRSDPSDVEEGLWRQFGKAGTVESVRVVRDGTTRVGKGFAYVQFQDEVAMEKALLYNDMKFPPLLPRALRVTRAKKLTKNASKRPSQKGASGADNRSNAKDVAKINPTTQSLSGRAGKLFGRAGAAHMKRKADVDGGRVQIARTPEQVVFEGYRASRKAGGGAKIGGSGKRQGKPRTRSSRRGAAFKAKGGKKAGAKA